MFNHYLFFRRTFQTLAVLAGLALSGSSVVATQLVWTNTTGGNWNVATNWSPNLVPTAADTVVITNAGSYTVTNSATVTVSTIVLGLEPGTNAPTVFPQLKHLAGTLTVTNLSVATNAVVAMSSGITIVNSLTGAGRIDQTTATLLILNTGTINTYNLSGGEQRSGILTVTNFNWTAGDLNSDGAGQKVIVAVGGVLNYLGATDRYLSYYVQPGRGLDNNGTWNWLGSGNLRGNGAAVVNNYGTVNVSTNPQFNWGGSSTVPTWNNFGAFNKIGGTNFFYFYQAALNNSGSITINSGNLSVYSSTYTGSGSISAVGPQLQFYASTATNNGAFSVGAGTLFTVDAGGTLGFGPTSSLNVPGTNNLRFNSGTTYLNTANVTAPSIWIAGGTVVQTATNQIPVVNQSAGTWQLTVPSFLATYNLTNGDLRGGTVTVTNFTWTDGVLYALNNGDKIIIPTNGVFNLLGTGEKSLYYFAPATQGYGIDNYGTWNWSGACILRGFGSTVNNYGSVNLTAPTLTYYSYYSLAYPAPRWNNYGTFTKASGAGAFSFNGAIVNNLGTLDVQTGTCTFESSTKFTNSAVINLGASAVLLNDGGAESTWGANGIITAPTANSIRIPSGTVYLQTLNLTTPALWINGGTLYQAVPNVVSNINQSSGTWWLTLTTGVNTYNLTNGTLRGGTLTVTNFAWTDGGLYANTNGDKLIIPTNGVFNLLGAGEKSLFYYAPANQGYGIDNRGIWNWSGSCILRGFGSVVNNNGTVNMTASGAAYYSYYSSGYPTPIWNNYGNFLKSGGAGVFYFNGCYLNNFGGVSASAGTLSINGSVFANSGSFGSSGTLLQFYGANGTNTGSINLGSSTPVTVDGGSTITLAPTASLSAPTLNSVQLISGSLAVESLNLNTPSIWINGGTLLQRTNIVVSTINESAGFFQMDVPGTLNQLNQTNGYVQGRNLTVTNWLWLDGYQMRGTPSGNANDDRTLIPVGGTLTLAGANPHYLSYYTGTGPSRTLDNNGTINWTSAALLYSYGVVNNYGTVTVSGVGAPQYAAANGNLPPTWNNYGNFTRTNGTVFYFNTCYLNNFGSLNLWNGTLSIYASTFTNVTGSVNLSANTVFQTELGAAATFNGASSINAPTLDSIRLGGASAAIETTNIVSPSIWLQAGTLYQRTNIVVAALNESGGALQMDVACELNRLNQTNGYVQGRNLTVTNWLWLDGYHFRGTPGINTNDDRTIIPAGGTLTFPGTLPRYLSYYSGTGPSRTLDNYGTINWTGSSILYSYGALNNYGSTLVSGVGTPQYAAYNGSIPPTWNNYGTFTRTNGTIFYFNTSYLNNSGTMDVYGGTLSIYASVFTNTTGTVNISSNSLFQSELGSSVVLNGPSRITAPTLDSIRLGGASAAIETTNIVSPSIWLQAGTLYQRTNIVIAALNESGGALQLDVPCALNQFNQTNGLVQGRNLTVTNWNWYAGDHYRGTPGLNTNDDRTIIPAGGVMNLIGTAQRFLTYYSGAGPSRTLDNYGTINWTGAAILYSYGTLNNYGTTAVSAVGVPQYAAYNGSLPPTWNNYGTFTRTNGTIFYFSTAFLNNFGTMDIFNGTLSIYASRLTNVTGTINISASSLLQVENSGVAVFSGPSRLTAPTADSIRLGGASANIETTNIVSPSIWLQAGTLYQTTNIVVSTINESGGALQLDVPCALNQFNQTNGLVQGRNLTVTNWNWYAGDHYRGTPGLNTNDDRTIIPAGGVMNLIGTAQRFLTYYSGVGPSRTLDNYGTINWTGNAVFYSYGTLNNYGSTIVTAVGTPQYAAYNGSIPPTWNNYGTFTRTNGTVFYFATAFLNNFGLMDVQSGTLSIYGSTFTNLAGGNVLARFGTVVANDNGSASTYEPGSSLGCASTNAFQINSGTVTLRTTAITAPSLWINGGTLNQNTNIAVPVVNESAGVWRLNVPASLATYNLTNGELRGANLAVDTFNWLGGSLNSDGPNSNLVTVATALNIVSATAKSMSYYTAPGRTVINNGNALWGGGSITFSGQSSFVNNGNWNVTNDVTLGWTLTGAAAPLFQNNGTFTKSAGAGILTLGSTTFTNNGTVAINSGGFTVGGPFVQMTGSAFLGTNFSASADVRILSGSLSGKGSIAGAYYNNGAANPGASPGYMNGNTFTNTAAATYNIEIGGNTGAGTNYDQLRFSGPVTLDGTLNVSLYNGYALILSNRFTVLTTSARSGTFANVIPPPGATLNTIYSSTNVILEVAALTNAPLQILTNPVSQTIWTPDPVSFAASVSGTTPILFQWQFNGTNISGATNNTYSLASVAMTNAGLYTLQIVDGIGGTTNTSATLTVIPFNGTIWWTNVLGGNWSVPANWLPNRIPMATNNVVIVSNGTYTVTVDVAAALSNLTVGTISATGTPTVDLLNGQSLTVGGNTSWETNTVLALNGLFQMRGGSNSLRGQINWQLGTLAGAGRSVIAANATLTFLGSLNQKFISTNILENYGTFNYGNDSFGNAQGLRFTGGAQLTNYASGVINIGTAAYDYSGAQTPRSYLVNYGTINAGSSSVFSPSYISIDFINYGLLYDFGYIYLSRGTNYGTFQYYNTLCEVSVFGDEANNEYFSFEDGTVFTGTYPLLAVGGYAQWNATSVHPGRVTVLSGSGGYSFTSPEFRVLKNYTQSGETVVYKGRWTQANPALTADLNNFSDTIINGFHYFVITNAGTLRVNNLSHTVRTFVNSGSIIVRSNLTLSGSSYTYGGGSIAINNSALATFSGGTVEAQTVLNHGTNTVNGSLAFIGNTYYRNYAGARTYFGGGSFVTGPASLLNEGLLDGFGGLALTTVTNRGTVLANDSLNRNLALGTYQQESGLTDLNPGQVSGNLEILGGVLSGTNTINGSVRNTSTYAPGKPFGLLSVTGNFTNAAGGTYFLPISGARAITNFPQTRVTGTSVLAGTLFVNFTNGFTPAPGNLFTAMIFSARSGVFDAIVNDTYGLEAFYTPTSLVLRAENLLPNVTLAVVGGSNQLVCQTFRITASATDPDGVVTNLIVRLNGSPVASSTGTALKATADSDFPTQLSLVAQATDDRSGVRTVTLPVNIYNYSATNRLFLGGVRSNDFKMCLVGEPGKNYDIYGNTNLITTNWINLGTMTVSNGTWRYLDPFTLTNRPLRFYRAKQLP